MYLCWLCVLACLLSVVHGRLSEPQRLEEYAARNYTWPPREDEYTPNTLGWRKIFQRRFRQIDRLGSGRNSYNGYMSNVHAGLLSKNFTESGWGLTKAPQPLVDALVQSLKRGLAGHASPEGQIACIATDEEKLQPLMIEQEDLNQQALELLKPILEAWSGAALEGNNAYGLRVYRNTSELNMHLDKHNTHIISAILHVGHDENSEPWPIVIEDFHGNLNAVTLEEGDMLLYESSKCMHGRPLKFNGDYYSSLFIHYFPVDWDPEIRTKAHYRVPPTWRFSLPDPTVEDLVVIDTSFREPNCPSNWCGLKDAVHWSGPAPGYGKVLSATGTRTLNLPPELELPYYKEHPPRDEL